MKYLSIEKELKRCREANKDVKVGDVMCFIHHGKPVEILNEPLENRLNYILEAKPKEERAIRFHWLRKCPFEMPEEFAAANSEWKDAYSKFSAANSEWNAANSKWNAQINISIKFYFPDCPWDGKALFPC